MPCQAFGSLHGHGLFRITGPRDGQPFTCRKPCIPVPCIEQKAEMTWRQYAQAILVFSFVCYVALMSFSGTQAWLPHNPAGLGAVSPALGIQYPRQFCDKHQLARYAGEATMSYATQNLALTVQNFVSAAVGMAVLVALIRGFTAISANTHVTLGRHDSGQCLHLLPPSIICH